MKTLLVRMVLLMPCVSLIGCVPTPRQTAAGTWTVQKRIAEEDQVMALVHVSDSGGLSEASSVFRDRIVEAQSLALRERSRCLADIGIAAFFSGCYDESATALDEAISVMGGFTSDPELVARVISLQGSEQERIFKGEPHERAVVFLVRGLVFLGQGDLDNARACFKAGQIQDSRFVDGRAEWGDWFSLRYLETLTDFWEGGSGAQERTRSTPAGLCAGWPQDGHDSLLVVACGFSPKKVLLHTSDEYRLSYLASESPRFRVLLSQPNVASPVLALDEPAEDLFIQAASHGRREMDEVLEAKRRFSDSALQKADVAEGIGVAAGQFGAYGLPVVLVSAAFSKSEQDAAASTSKAPDLRQLCCIPGLIYLGTFRSSSEPTYLTVVGHDGTEAYRKLLQVPGKQSHPPRVVSCRLFK